MQSWNVFNIRVNERFNISGSKAKIVVNTVKSFYLVSTKFRGLMMITSLSCQILVTSLFEIFQKKQKSVYYLYKSISCPHFTNLVKEVANK